LVRVVARQGKFTMGSKYQKIMLAAILVAMAVSSTCAALFCGHDNCYELLGVVRNASKSDIRRAYRRLSVEKHPDKRPGDAKAAEEFGLIGNAYTALKDDGKRAKYDDFLDNPGKYWDFLMQNSREYYAPKTNTVIAITLILGVASLIHWLHMNQRYKSTLDRMRESPEFKREVSRLVKTKAAANAEDAEAMMNVEIVGLEEPHWKNLLVVRLSMIPVRLYNYVKWVAHWQYSYKICKREYTEDDKQYLIMKNLQISEREWERMAESAQEKLLAQKLWELDLAAEYLRLERISLNRAGKLKKRRQQGSVAVVESETREE
jgi:DnaJ homolog subfamily C member 25